MVSLILVYTFHVDYLLHFLYENMLKVRLLNVLLLEDWGVKSEFWFGILSWQWYLDNIISQYVQNIIYHIWPSLWHSATGHIWKGSANKEVVTII